MKKPKPQSTVDRAQQIHAEILKLSMRMLAEIEKPNHRPGDILPFAKRIERLDIELQELKQLSLF